MYCRTWGGFGVQNDHFIKDIEKVVGLLEPDSVKEISWAKTIVKASQMFLFSVDKQRDDFSRLVNVEMKKYRSVMEDPARHAPPIFSLTCTSF